MSSLHEQLLVYESEFRFDANHPSQQIQQLLSGIQLMNAYKVLITDDTNDYQKYSGITTSFLFIDKKGKLYYHKDTKQVVLISSYDSDSTKKKVFQLQDIEHEDIKEMHDAIERQNEVHQNPFLMRLSANAYISFYTIPIMATLTTIYMISMGLSLGPILLTLFLYCLLFLFVLVIKNRYPM
jgi:hypothetical protein